MGTIKVGINGVGRIGKMVLLQTLADPERYTVLAINSTSLQADQLEDYLCYDSSHKYCNKNLNGKVEVVGPDDVVIDGQPVHIFRHRAAEEIKWKDAGVEYVLECTGAYLSTERASKHDVNHVIMSAPPKKCAVTPTYIFGVNHQNYCGEKIVSASSCTTNCMAPAMRLVSDAFGVTSAFFTTIHATTGSQSTVDKVPKATTRTHRSILGNIIPHSTGASKSVYAVLPELQGKIFGTSVRVPTINCSLLDLNVTFEKERVTIEEVEELFRSSSYFGSVYGVNTKALTSVDFLTTVTPSILDMKASMTMGNTVKMMLWYDNEWSYSAQVIRLMSHMFSYNEQKKRARFALAPSLGLSALDGVLIEKECAAISKLLDNGGRKVLGIMGGAKIADKQPMIKCLSKMHNARVFVGGGLTRGLSKAMPEVVGSKTIVVAKDAYGAADLAPTTAPKYMNIATSGGGFDIGPAGLRDLMAEIDAADVIFWSGCLGVVEDSRYRVGSSMIVDYLLAQTHKSVVVGGGGATARLFAGGVRADAPAHVHVGTAGGGALLQHIESVVCSTPTSPGLRLFAERSGPASGGLPSPPTSPSPPVEAEARPVRSPPVSSG